MKHKQLHSVAAILLLISLCGCATIYGRQNDEMNVHFVSNVQGVNVDCEGKSVVTPGNLALIQTRTHRCTASKEGFESKTFRVMTVLTQEGFRYSTDMNWEKWGKWTLGIGVLAGWSVDLISGAMRGLEKDRYVIEMMPSSETSVSRKVLNKTAELTKTIVLMPAEVVDGTTAGVMDKTLRTGSEAVGLGGEEKRNLAEGLVDGRKVAKRLEAQDQENAQPTS